MANLFADRVRETTTTTGTGSITLTGAASGYRTFNAAFGTSVPCYYVIELNSEWEVGLGSLSSSTVLARTTVIASSNSNSLVSFSAGTKNVFCDVPASWLTQFPKMYRATITQDGTTAAPTATVLNNTLGGTVVWTRNSAGIYTGTLSGAFTSAKTFVYKPSVDIGNVYDTENNADAYRLSANAVQLFVHASGSGVDGFNDLAFAVDVYY